MPRFNVERNGEWACFSTIVDEFITPFMPLAEYEDWRRNEYGGNILPVKQANRMDYAEALEIINRGLQDQNQILSDRIEDLETELGQLRGRIGSVHGFAEVGLEVIVNNFGLKETEKHLAYELAEVLLRDRLIEFWIEDGEHSCPKMLRASLQVLHPQRGGNEQDERKRKGENGPDIMRKQ